MLAIFPTEYDLHESPHGWCLTGKLSVRAQNNPLVYALRRLSEMRAIRPEANTRRADAGIGAVVDTCRRNRLRSGSPPPSTPRILALKIPGSAKNLNIPEPKRGSPIIFHPDLPDLSKKRGTICAPSVAITNGIFYSA